MGDVRERLRTFMNESASETVSKGLTLQFVAKIWLSAPAPAPVRILLRATRLDHSGSAGHGPPLGARNAKLGSTLDDCRDSFGRLARSSRPGAAIGRESISASSAKNQAGGECPGCGARRCWLFRG